MPLTGLADKLQLVLCGRKHLLRQFHIIQKTLKKTTKKGGAW